MRKRDGRQARLGASLAVVAVCFLSGASGARCEAADSGGGDEEVPQSYLSGNGLLNRGLYELAVAEYRTFLAEHGDHEKAPIARYGLAVSLYRMERTEDAQRELERLWSVADFGYAAESATMLGQVRLAGRDYVGAKRAFERVVREYGKHDLADDAGAGLVEALYFGEQYAEASRACGAFAERWSESPLRNRVLFFEASTAMSVREFEKAAERFAGLLKAEPDGPFAEQAAFFVAQCHHRDNASEKAVRAYRNVLKRSGGRFVADALYGLGVLLEQQGKSSEAGKLFDRMLEEFPESEHRIAGTMERGRVWFAEGQYDDAFEMFERVVEAGESRGDEAAYWTGKCRLRQGRFEEAAERLARAVKGHPKSDLAPEMLYDLGVARVQSGEPAAATKTLREFRRRYGEHSMAPDALQLLAVTAHRQGDYKQSGKYCREFAGEYPDHEQISTIWFVSAENDFLLGRYEAAARGYGRFVERFAGDKRVATARARLGTALYRLERYDEAEAYLSGAADGDDVASVGSADLALGYIYFQRGEWKQAEEHLERYLSGGGERASADAALLQLGLARQRMGKHEVALKTFDRIIGGDASEAVLWQALFERAQVLVALDRPDEAAQAFERVLREAGESRFAPYALNHLGAMAVRGGDYAEAVGYFEGVVLEAQEEGMKADALFGQGQALMAVRRYDEAEKVFGRLLREHGSYEQAARARVQRAIALARQDKHAAALGIMGQLEEAGLGGLDDSTLAALRYEQAWCLKETGKDKEAARVYERILDQHGDSEVSIHAAVELAEIEFDAGRHDRAATLLRPVRARMVSAGADVAAPVREQATYRLGVCEFELERFAEAGELFARFIVEFPESSLAASASYFAGEASFRSGRHEMAARHFGRVMKSHADDAACGPSMLRLGECLSALQRWARSEEVFGAYLKRFGESEQAYQAQFGVGWAQEQQGRGVEAMESYGRVVGRHKGPTAARSQFQIGECLFAGKRYEEAVRAYLKVDILYAYPEWSAASLYEAGRCFEELAKPVEARAQFSRVVAKYEQTRWARLAAKRLEQVSAAPVPGR